MSDEFLPRESNPLTINDVELIDNTNLNTNQKHHLRILAHCLFSFKNMKSSLERGVFPNNDDLLNWCKSLAQSDEDFAKILLEQMNSAASQIEDLAKLQKKRPLELTLEDLINSFESKYS
tara:strand:- start:1581 stop:1940 length:360 start_codon:yes stop_codon:yes gene_type:complete